MPIKQYYNKKTKMWTKIELTPGKRAKILATQKDKFPGVEVG